MQLFKRLLLSLFPDEMMANNVSPASMFISFISAKEFFSIINRKIIENYKLNLFDIAIDPFEFKIGFGDTKSFQKKDIDLYYGYCGTANINGYRFLNPSNIGNTLSIVIGLLTYELFDGYDDKYFINFMFCVYLLHFVFLARVRIFPFDDRENNYNWFIDLFFNFYDTIFEQSEKKYKKEDFDKIKKSLIGNSDIFFMLFEHYKLFNSVYYNDRDIFKDDFYKWIFSDELKKTGVAPLINDFITNLDEYVYRTDFTLLDKKVLQYVLPADILLKFMLIDVDINSVFSCIFSKVYYKQSLLKKLSTFRSGKGNLEELYMEITDYRNFKKGFFDGMQKYIVNVFRSDGNTNSFEEELDDMMSDIGGDPENLKDLKVPERVKKESKIVEKFLNFYVTLVGGLRIARGDNLFMRFFRKDLVNQILDLDIMFDSDKENTIHYYGSLLYNYGKNVFYYKNVSENIRAGKQKFFLPYKDTEKNIYSNMYIVNMFEENFLATLFQWINAKDVKLYVNNKKIISSFKNSFGRKISEFAKMNKEKLLYELYSNQFLSITEHDFCNKSFLKLFSDDDISHIKDNMYTLDFWIYEIFLSKLSDVNLSAKYSDINIYGIIANVMDTLPGFLMYINYLKNSKNKVDYDVLYDVYCQDVLNITKNYCKKFKSIIKDLENLFSEILSLWIDLDDNLHVFEITKNNWKDFIKGKEDIYKHISSVDVLWFKGYLKNITYYNKRYLIPK